METCGKAKALPKVLRNVKVLLPNTNLTCARSSESCCPHTVEIWSAVALLFLSKKTCGQINRSQQSSQNVLLNTASITASLRTLIRHKVHFYHPKCPRIPGHHANLWSPYYPTSPRTMDEARFTPDPGNINDLLLLPLTYSGALQSCWWSEMFTYCRKRKQLGTICWNQQRFYSCFLWLSTQALFFLSSDFIFCAVAEQSPPPLLAVTG